jgi:serine protease
MTKYLDARGLLAAAVAIALSLPVLAAGATQNITNAPAARFNVSGLQDNASYDRFIVTYRQGSSQAAQRAAAVQSVSAAIARAGLDRAATSVAGQPLKTVTAAYQRKLAIGADLVRTSRRLARAEALALIKQIAADPAVAFVEPDVLRHAVRDIAAPAMLAPTMFTPDDTYYGLYQWHLKAADGTLTSLISGTANRGGSNVNNAWDLADGTGVVIAVLDTGITQHQDIDSSLANDGYDFISEAFVSGRATNGRVAGGWDTGDWTSTEPWLSNSQCVNAYNPARNSSWHGTHVAGTTGAELTNNAKGMAGAAYGAKVLPVRVLGHCGGYDSDINDAIVWAAGGHVDGVPDNAHPAQVINLSLGGGGTCTAESASAQAIAKANALGAAVVVAAGNSDTDAGGFSPASCPGAIAVASVGVISKRAYYSNYGSVVKIAAPGGGVFANDEGYGGQVNDGFVWQALNGGATTPIANSSLLGGMAGTSQAAPHVAGTVALMQSARLALHLSPLTPDKVLEMLQSTAIAPAVTPPADRPIGAGIVDAYAAVSQAVAYDPRAMGAIPLSNRVQVANQSGAAGSLKVYKLDVPAGAVGLSLRTMGGKGDVSLYVSRGKVADAGNYGFKSVHAGNNESVAITRPTAGTYYLSVVGEADYSGVTVLGTFTPPPQ